MRAAPAWPAPLPTWKKYCWLEVKSMGWATSRHLGEQAEFLCRRGCVRGRVWTLKAVGSAATQGTDACKAAAPSKAPHTDRVHAAKGLNGGFASPWSHPFSGAGTAWAQSAELLALGSPSCPGMAGAFAACSLATSRALWCARGHVWGWETWVFYGVRAVLKPCCFSTHVYAWPCEEGGAWSQACGESCGGSQQLQCTDVRFPEGA